MKKLLFISMIGLLLASCSTVHKSIQSSHTDTDSVASVAKDSATSHDYVDSSDYMYLQNSDVTIEYGPDSVKAVDTFSNKKIQALHDVVKAVSGTKVPKKITIHIGTLATAEKHISDSGGTVTHYKDTATLKKKVDTSSKIVERKRAPLFLTIGAIIVGLILIVFLIYKIAPSILKKFI